MIKTLNKLGIEGNYLNLRKGIYEKSTENIILNGETLKVSLKISEKEKDIYPHHFYPTCTGGSSQCN